MREPRVLHLGYWFSSAPVTARPCLPSSHSISPFPAELPHLHLHQLLLSPDFTTSALTSCPPICFLFSRWTSLRNLNSMCSNRVYLCPLLELSDLTGRGTHASRFSHSPVQWAFASCFQSAGAQFSYTGLSLPWSGPSSLLVLIL